MPGGGSGGANAGDPSRDGPQDDAYGNIYPEFGKNPRLTDLAKEEADHNRKHQIAILKMLMLFMLPWLVSTYVIVVLVMLGIGYLSDYVLGTLIVTSGAGSVLSAYVSGIRRAR